MTEDNPLQPRKPVKALVTGGATGIGEGIALALADAGADVALTYRSHQPDATLAAIESKGRKAAAEVGALCLIR